MFIKRNPLAGSIIVVDIDDTMMSLAELMVDGLNKKFGTNKSLDDCTEWNVGSMFDMSREEFNQWLTTEFDYTSLPLFPNVVEYFTDLKEKLGAQIWVLSHRGFSEKVSHITLNDPQILSFPFDRMDMVPGHQTKCSYVEELRDELRDEALARGKVGADAELHIVAVYDDHPATLRAFEEGSNAVLIQPKVFEYAEEVGDVINPHTFYTKFKGDEDHVDMDS